MAIPQRRVPSRRLASASAAQLDISQRLWNRLSLGRRLALESLEARALLSATPGAVALDQEIATPTYEIQSTPGGAAPDSTTSPTGLTATQFRTAYGINQISLSGGVQGTGAGQTIALVDAYDDPNAASDLHNFDVAMGLADPPSFSKVSQTGSMTNLPPVDSGDESPDTWELEESLDIEWAHAVAPQANILLVEANSDAISDLLAGVTYAKTVPSVSVVSMSWGADEASNEASYDSTFTTPTGHAGITFLASTGDEAVPAGYPAYSPNVVAVGGTSLTINATTYAWQSETAWSDSGGGISAYEAQPSYQKGVVTQSTTMRTTPDISLDADPNTGVAVYDTYDDGTAAPWIQVGGTSLSSPTWAGLIAITDQGRAAEGLGSLDGPSQALPGIYGLPTSVLHDITSGSNGYPAGPGYDLVTGRGTPIANTLVPDLVGTPPTTTTLSASQSSITYGQSVTLTATVSATPTPGEGAVTFFTGGTLLGAAAVSGGVATLTVTSLPAGSDALSATYADPLGGFGSSTGIGPTVSVAKAPLTITVNNQTKLFGAGAPPFTASFAGFVNGDTSASLTTQPVFSTTATSSSPVSGSPYAITASGAVDPNYTIAYAPGALTVTAANTSTALVASLTAITYGYAVTLTATVSSILAPNEGTVAFTSNGATLGTASVSGGVATLVVTSLPFGANTLSATYSDASGNYLGSSAGSGTTVSVTPAPLIITADNQSMVVGGPLPMLTASYFGLVNGDSPASLATPPTLSTTATTSSPVSGSPYPITISGAVDANYAITYVPGQLTIVNSQSVTTTTLQASSTATTYGQSLTLTLTVSSAPTPNEGSVTFYSGSNTIGAAAVSNGVASLTLSSLPVGSDVLSALYTDSQGGFSNSFASGPTVVVGLAPLTITANNQTKVYGAALPTLTGTVTGLASGDVITVSFVSTATAASPVLGGGYAITPIVSDPNDRLSNYSLTIVDAALTIAPAPLTITANSLSKTYGVGLPALTASYTGLVNGDTPASMTTQPTLSTTATAASTVAGSPYPITVSGAVDSNYAIIYAPGALTVTIDATSTSLSASASTVTYGTSVTLTATVTGAVTPNEGTVTFKSGAATLGTAAISGGVARLTLTSLPAGSDALSASYSDTIGNFSSGNSSGGPTVTVNKAPLTITANSLAKVYGAALPTLTATYAGFVNGDTAASLTTAPSLSTTATSTSPVSGSPYSIIVNGAVDPNYTISYVAGSLSVTVAPTTITVSTSPATVSYGQSLALIATISSTFALNEGTVAFSCNGFSLGVAPVIAGIATLNLASLPLGSDSLGAVFSDTNGNAASVSTNEINTVAGNGTAGTSHNNVLATSTTLNQPAAVAVDAAGDIFIADDYNQQIREVEPNGLIVTVAGTGVAGFSGDGGPALLAELNYPTGIAVDAAGDLFIADSLNNRIREVIKSTGLITTVAGSGTEGFSGDNGLATAAELSNPSGIAVDAAGDLFIADRDNERIREVTKATGLISTVAGNSTGGFAGDNGPAASAVLHEPTNVALDAAGDLFITDTDNWRVREITKSTGLISTVAGNGNEGYGGDGGPATSAGLYFPNGIVVDSAGDLFIADSSDNRVREVNHATNVITTVAGNGGVGTLGDGGPATAANLFIPYGVALDAAGDLFIADADDERVREVLANPILIVTQATPGVTVSDAGGMYNGSSFSATARINGSSSLQGISPTLAYYAGPLATGIPLAGAPSNAGTYTVVASFPGDTDYFSAQSTPLTFVIAQAPLTVTGNNASMMYGGALPIVGGSLSGVIAGDGITASFSTTAVTSSHVISGGYPIIGTLSDPNGKLANYAVTYANATLTITPVPLTITANSLFMELDTALPPLTANYSGFVDNDSPANLTTAPMLSTTATATSPASATPYPIMVSGAADTDYTITLVEGGLTITTSPAPIITVNDPGGQYDGAPFAATSMVNNFTSLDGISPTFNYYPGANSGGTPLSVAPVNVGTYTVVANFPGSANYNPGQSNPVTFVISPAPLIITANSLNKTYGAALPTLSGSISGEAPNDGITASFGATATSASPVLVGGYPITPTISDPKGKLSNYAVTYIDGTLTVTPAALAITAGNLTKVYGSAMPSLTAIFTGFVNGETVASLNAQPTLTTTATTTSSVNGGPYPITASGAVDPNYSFTYVAGSLAVTPVSGSLTLASSQTAITYGQSVTLTATLAAATTPDEGTVTFSDNGVTLGVANVVAGVATLSLSTLAAGADSVSAIYGDAPSGDFSAAPAALSTPLISTIAGTGQYVGDGGSPTATEISNPQGVVTDWAGDLFIADTGHNVVREVSLQGVVSTIAGNGTAGYSGDGGQATAAELDHPQGLAVSSTGILYISDALNHRIRAVNLSTGIITTIAGNGTFGESGDGKQATAAEISIPYGLALDAAGDLFFADTDNNRIREVNTAGIITTVAGNGTQGFAGDGGAAISAELILPEGVAVDSSGDLFIADTDNNRVREVSASTGVIMTVAGNGLPFYNGDGAPAMTAGMVPADVVLDAAGDLFVADGDRVREIFHSSQIITTVAGTGIQQYSGDGGPANEASFAATYSIALDLQGNLYIASYYDNRVRKVNLAQNFIATWVGNGFANYSGDGGPATSSVLSAAQGVAVDSAGNVFIADTANNVIREINSASGIITTIAGTGVAGYSGDGGQADNAELDQPYAVALDNTGDLFIADYLNNSIRKVNLSTGVITTVAGNGSVGFSGDGGLATAASLFDPTAIALDAAGDIFIADTGNNRIREVVHATGIITTIVGNGTAGYNGDGLAGLATELDYPDGVAVDSSGDVFISDEINNRIRELNATTGLVSTVAGTGTAGSAGDGGKATLATITHPAAIALDASGNLLIADTGNSRIREVNHFSGLIATVAGNGTAGFGGDGGLANAAELNNAYGIAVGSTNNIFIADSGNSRIREVSMLATVAIAKATPSVTVSDSGGVYSGHPYSAAALVAGVVSGVDSTPAPSLEAVAPTLNYYFGSVVTGTPLTSVPTNPGTYTVVASFAGSQDYAAVQSEPVTFDITPANAPTVTTSAGATTATAAFAAAIDPGLTLTDGNTSATFSATVTITSGFQTGDVLTLPAQAGFSLTTSSNGTLMISSNSASVSAFQAALASVTLTGSSTTGSRTISFSVTDTNDSQFSNTATKQVNVVPPAEVTAIYVSGSEWSPIFLSDIASAGLGSATYGYLLQTGATQLHDLPWFNIDTITVQFSVPVTVNTSASGMSLYGVNTDLPSTSAPSNATDVQTISWTLSNFPGVNQVGLANNQYMLALPDAAVTDAQGAPLDGAFTNSAAATTGGALTTTGQSLPSGKGLAGSADSHGFAGFEFQFNVLPGDANQNTGVNSQDVVQIRLGLAGAYSVYSDIDGNGADAARDVALARVELGAGTVSLPSSPPVYPFSAAAAPLAVIAADGSASMYLAAVSGSSTSPSTLDASVGAPLALPMSENNGSSSIGTASGTQPNTGIASGTRAGDAIAAIPVETLAMAPTPSASVNLAIPAGASLAAPSVSTSIGSGLSSIVTNQAPTALLAAAPTRITVSDIADAAKKIPLPALDRSADIDGPTPLNSASPSARHAAIDRAIQDFEF